MMANIVPTETVFGRGRLEKLHGKLKSNDIQTGHARWAELKKKDPSPHCKHTTSPFCDMAALFPSRTRSAAAVHCCSHTGYLQRVWTLSYNNHVHNGLCTTKQQRTGHLPSLSISQVSIMCYSDYKSPLLVTIPQLLNCILRSFLVEIRTLDYVLEWCLF